MRNGWTILAALLLVSTCTACGDESGLQWQNGSGFFQPNPNPNPGASPTPTPSPTPSATGQAVFHLTIEFSRVPARWPLDRWYVFSSTETQGTLVTLTNLPTPGMTSASGFPFTFAHYPVEQFLVFQFSLPNRHVPYYPWTPSLVSAGSIEFEAVDYIVGTSLNAECSQSISLENGTMTPNAAGDGYTMEVDQVYVVTHATDASLCQGWL